MHLLLVLEKAGPELLLKLLLPENKLDVAVSVVDFGVLGVDLGKEVQRNVVCYALSGGALERDILLRDAESSVGLGNLGNLDVDVKEVALRVRVG